MEEVSGIHSNLETIVRNLTSSPGVYMFLNEKDQIIYVGKAKNLKKRVSSYFQKSHHDNAKVRIMVSKIRNIRFVMVDSEADALLLENNLIKKYLPRYNILLKDDKTYPWICISNEPFPRVFSTRNVIKNGSLYFGPYTSMVMVRTLLDLIQKLYSLRNCGLNLSAENINQKKYKVCLEFHMGNCKGPCVNLQDETEYSLNIEFVKEILKGNLGKVLIFLKKLMADHAEKLNFEDASLIKDKLDHLEKFQSKSTVVNPSINNVDVYSTVIDKNIAIVNFLKVMNGCIIQSHNLELHRRLDESEGELLEMAMVEIRERFSSFSPEIILPVQLSISFPNVQFIVPKIGDKRKLLELSQRNAHFFLLERRKNAEKANPELRYERVLKQLQSDLHLRNLPKYIECFDNSNIQGTNPVSSCVVFKGGKPSKSDYRHFNVKTVAGPNDFATMEEVVFRRYRRLKEENSPLPDLIIIDGGKGQLGAAVESLKKLDLYGVIAIIGIAKRLEEIFFPNDSIPIYLDKRSESLKLIQQLRDEAHRFGITFHRNKRSSGMIGTKLEKIPGIGGKTIELLYERYSSISRMKEVSKEELVSFIGEKKADVLVNFLANIN